MASGTDTFDVPAGYRWDGAGPLGRPDRRGRAGVRPDQPDGGRAGQQFGYNCDYLDVIPLDGKQARRPSLVVNHEYTNESIMFPPTTDAEQLTANKRAAIAAHGLSVVSLKRAKAGEPVADRPVDAG